MRNWTIEELTEALSQLPALKKLHVSWPYASEILDPSTPEKKELAIEVVNILGTLAIRLQETQRMDVVLDKLKPYGNLPLVVHHSPMRKSPHDVDYWGDDWWKEIGDYQSQLNYLSTNDQNVETVVLDAERYVVDDGGHLERKLQMFYTIAKGMFPDAKVMFYNAHCIQRASVEGGWEEYQKHPWGVETDYANLSQYHPMDEYRQIEEVKRTLDNTDIDLILNLSLGSMWGHEFSRQWHNGEDYPRELSWNLGGMVNNSWYGKDPDRFYNNSRVAGVWFWPDAIDSNFPLIWAIHFHAYCQGVSANKVEL